MSNPEETKQIKAMNLRYKKPIANGLNLNLPWCANCKYGQTLDDGYVFCKQIEGYRMEDDFCGLHEWEDEA